MVMLLVQDIWENRCQEEIRSARALLEAMILWNIKVRGMGESSQVKSLVSEAGPTLVKEEKEGELRMKHLKLR